MDKEHKIMISLTRTKETLGGLLEVLQPFLASKNGVSGQSRESVAAFNITERFCYNSRGALLLFDEYVRNHNMALPISQIFRVMAHDVLVAYWLFGEADTFASRMGAFNSEFIRTNTSKILEVVDESGNKIIDEAGKQRIWRGWQKTAPHNFTPQSDGRLEYTRCKDEKQLREIGKLVVQKQNKFFLKALPNAYNVLSQQAHVSEFSKELIYQKIANHVLVFDCITRAVLPAAFLLLQKIDGSEVAQIAINKLNK